MEKKKSCLQVGKDLLIVLTLCMALLFGRETMYALQMETTDVDVEIPVFMLLMEGEENSYLTTAFYVQDANGNTYLLSSVYATAYLDAGYKLSVVAEGFWEDVTAAEADVDNGLSYLKVNNIEGITPFVSESTMDDKNGVLAFLSMEDQKFIVEAGNIDISGFNKSNGVYYIGSYIESTEDLLLLGAPYLKAESAGVMGMVSMTTDSEVVVYDLTQLDFKEEMAIVTGTPQSQPEEPQDSEQETEQPANTQEPENTQDSNESENPEGEVEEQPSDAQNNQPSENQQSEVNQAPKDYGWLIVVMVVIVVAAFYAKSNQKKKPEQSKSDAMSEDVMYPNGTIMLSDDEQRKIDAALSSQNQMNKKEVSGMRWQIRGISGVFAGQVFVLEEILDFGRNMYCKVTFPQDTKGISNKHCYLRVDNNVVMICDENSSYGTYLNKGTRLEPGVGYQLNDGDVFYLASQEQGFRLEFVRAEM